MAVLVAGLVLMWDVVLVMCGVWGGRIVLRFARSVETLEASVVSSVLL